ncbi:Cystathionine gamma-lyase [Sciurus carolinensis]|uniref:Cystathionine gamma-lyase n=1 Tax=Sciurus carolinensis TaxID=30640 RepID=A0AA41N3A9_SCICA|nr:Cystathionine gamma-lyase [Sciurus carolinensis]
MGLVSINSEDLHNRLHFLQKALGAVLSPMDCYLCNRHLKTLQIRMKKNFKNGMAVAQFLESNPQVEKVIYPGLPSHPQHEVAKRQCTGCPGMITFIIKGTLRHAETFLKNLKLFTLAESLGGYESLVEFLAIMTHASVPKNDRDILGISDTLIRLSVGLEDEKDLLEDLDQPLKAAHPSRGNCN